MFDCVVVGSGPAGLATSVALSSRGVDHVLLERGRVGESWRTQRWDTLRLNNPGWMNPMLGAQARDHYLTAAEVVERLNMLALTCPVREGVRAIRLARAGDGWVLRTDDVNLRARTVVVATGGENVPQMPALAPMIPGRVAQYHAADYRNPQSLPQGAVLVAGSGQSGFQVAEDLLAAGRAVVLATSPVGRAPARHRGRYTVEWLSECGFFDQRPGDLPDPATVKAPQPLIAPGGRSVSLQTLARAGATLTGRLAAVDGEQVRFDQSLLTNIAAGDAAADRIRAMVDAFISRGGQHVPPAESDPADIPLDPAELDPPARCRSRMRHLVHRIYR